MEENKNVAGKFLDPEAIIAQLDVKKGEAVADFGCGPGYFSIPFAKKIGNEGRLHALDILPQALETVAAKAKNLGLLNISTKRVNLEKEHGSKLENDSVDWVVLKDVLFQNKEREIIIEEVYRVLKNGGKVILVEWNSELSAVGPAQELRLAQQTLERMFANQKFVVEKNIEAGDFHYAFVAIKS